MLRIMEKWPMTIMRILKDVNNILPVYIQSCADELELLQDFYAFIKAKVLPHQDSNKSMQH